jgi:hypothetical protein
LKNIRAPKPFLRDQRALSAIISFIMIIGIIMAGLSIAYSWGRPLIYGMRDSSMIQRIVGDMETLADNTWQVVHEGRNSQRTTVFKFDRGTLIVLPTESYGNISFTFTGPSLSLQRMCKVGAVEFQLHDSYTTLVEDNGIMYYRGGSDIVVSTNTQGGASVSRIALQKIDSFYVIVRFDMRAFLYNYTDSSDSVHIIIYLYQLNAASSGATGKGPGLVYAIVKNIGTEYDEIASYTPSSSGTLTITARFNNGPDETAFSLSVSKGKQVTIEMLVTKLEVSIQ